MSAELALVGDIHGNLVALRALWSSLLLRDVQNVIFLGDYINKGPQSAEVLRTLIELSEDGRATLLAGNHETALLDALDRKDLSAFLKMGGAMTIRSYVGGQVGPDVLAHFTEKLPPAHIDALRRMPSVYETDDLVAQHVPSRLAREKFLVSAHVLVGPLPRIRERSAQLDTGCGGPSGRLTALFWPTLDYVQVDAEGSLLTS
jgi:serine/threonine protein phosphatase 1